MTNSAVTMPSDAMERAQLAQEIHAVRVGNDLVLLDLSGDDYLCLPNAGLLIVEGETVRGPLNTLLRLSAEELLHSGEPAPRRISPPPLPRLGLPPVSIIRPGLADIATFTAIWIDAVRTRPTLRRLARRVEERHGRRDDVAAIAARVEIFNELLPWAPWTGACLLQAELLLRFLNAGGLDADWVFGVRTWPFLAHCWLQVGDRCVSQAPDTLTIYRPILAV